MAYNIKKKADSTTSNRATSKIRLVFSILLLSLMVFNTASAKQRNKRNIFKMKTPSCRALRSMARVYMAYGEYGKAQPLAERALALAKQRNVSNKELGSCLLDLAYIYNNQNKFVEAEELCILGLKLQEKVYYESHPYIAYTLRTLASIYRGQGNYEEATNALDRAMAIMLETHPENDQAMAPFYVDFAKLLVSQSKFEKAENLYLKALDMINNSYGGEHLYTAEVLGNIAELYTLQGRHKEAEPLITQALSIQRKVYGPEHHLLAKSWLTMAKIHKAKGEHAELEELIQKALNAVAKTDNVGAIQNVHLLVAQIRENTQLALGTTANNF